MTATLSPLDVVINPIIKQIGKGDYRKYFNLKRVNGEKIVAGKEAWGVACAAAISSYIKIQKSTVKRSFTDALGELGPEACRIAFEEVEELKREMRQDIEFATAPQLTEIDSILAAFSTEFPALST
jgi:hypothetical protein